jgi:SAM-dependent methyltransferase
MELANRVCSLEGCQDPQQAYDEAGRALLQQLLARLPDGFSFESRRVLDFGCGAGRVLRHLLDEATAGEVWGCDIDAPSIAWLESHLSPPLRVFRCAERPPLPFADESIDLVWALSVFTHIDDAWSDWLLEIHRILSADGTFIATFMSPELAEEISGEPFVERHVGMNVLRAGQSWTHGGPMVLHSPWWIREHWGRAFEISHLDSSYFRATVDGASQGIVVMRKREGTIGPEELEAPKLDDPREMSALRSGLLQTRREVRELRHLLGPDGRVSVDVGDRDLHAGDPTPNGRLHDEPVPTTPSTYHLPANFEIDLEEETSHAAVLQLVGSGKRVLELGCSTGYMSRVLAQSGCEVVGVEIDAGAATEASAWCERVIIADLDLTDLSAELGDDGFDVVLAADVLEHLKDPERTLRALLPHLRPGGCVVASLPNVTHASVRLALLQGEFPYAEHGLLDRTHLRFFSRSGVFELMERSGYAVTGLEAVTKTQEMWEIPFDREAVDGAVRDALEQDPDAQTYQFVVLAHRVPEGVPHAVAHRLHHLMRDLDLARSEWRAREARINELAAAVEEREERLVAVASSEAEVRRLLHRAHEQIAEREAQAERCPTQTTGADIARLRAEHIAREQSLAQQIEMMRDTRAWRLASRYWALRERLGSHVG